MYAALAHGAHHGGGVGDAGALDNLVGVEDAVHGVAALFPLYAFGVEHGGVAWRHGAVVAEEHAHAFVLGEDGCAGAALAGAEHYYFLFAHSAIES